MGKLKLSTFFKKSSNRNKSTDKAEEEAVLSDCSELEIVFVYDTEHCKREEDDPREAILYFHPPDVGEGERIAICGQLMGVTQFLMSTFTCPKVISLEQGKFAIKQFGRYLLVIGCNSGTSEWLLQQQMAVLNCLMQFYQKDLDTVFASVDGDRTRFQEKLAHLFDMYLPMSLYHGDSLSLTFGIIPTLTLPKSAKNVFLEASLILQSCQQKTGALGGSILFQNKVVATQLNAELTKKVAFFKPFPSPLPAEAVQTSFRPPIGVQLLQVYLTEQEFHMLQRGASWFKDVEISRNVLRKKTVRQHEWEKPSRFGIMPVRNEGKPVMPITEEDEGEMGAASGLSEVPKSVPSAGGRLVPETLSAVVHKLTDLLDTKKAQQPPTPQEETAVRVRDFNSNNVLQHEGLVSVCDGLDKQLGFMKLFSPNMSPTKVPPKNGDLQAGSQNSRTSAENDIIRFGTNSWDKFANKSFSLDDLREKSLLSAQNPFHFYSFGLPSLVARNCCKNKDSSKESPGDDCGHHVRGACFYNSIADPWSPIFRSDGIAVSKYLYEEFVAETANLWRGMISPCPTLDRSISEELLNLATDRNAPEKANENCAGTETEPRDLQLQKQALSLPLNGIDSPRTVLTASDKKGLFTLPLDKVTDNPPLVHESNKAEQIIPFKLIPSPSPDEELETGVSINGNAPSLLSSTSSTNPEESQHSFLDSFKRVTNNILSPITMPKNFANSDENQLEASSSTEVSDSVESAPKAICDVEASNTGELCGVALYVQQHMNMLLLVLLEEEAGKEPEVIHSLWETGLAALGELEVTILCCQDQPTAQEQADPYSYLSFEPSWGTLTKGGKEEDMNLDVVQSLHQSFNASRDLTELIFRCEDHVVFGHHCADSEVFYQQSAGLKTGLPMPSDLMGKVPLKARRRLERDHNIIIL